jgi:hypothetical protein
LFDQLAQKIEENLPDLLSQTEDLLTLDQEMMEYYANAFDAAQDEFDSYLELIDHGVSKLEHFKDMLSLIGKENNDEMMSVVL